MNKELIIWNDPKESTTSYSTELGLAYEVFQGCKVFVVCKDNDKKAVIMFKDKQTGKVATAIMQTEVDKDFRAKRFGTAEALSFPIVRMEKLVRKNSDGSETVITNEPTLWLGKPGQGWQDIVEAQVKKVTNYEDLAV